MKDWRLRADDYLHRLKKPRVKKYYRCGKPCLTRKVLKRELWQYIRPPKCEACGQVNWYVDLYRNREQREKIGGYAVCYCDGFHHPHRPGSTERCDLYKGEIK